MNNLYKQAILELYQDQTNRGNLENPSFSASLSNPLCGDTVSISGLHTDDLIQTVRFTAHGCVLSQAAAAFVVNHSQGKSIDKLYTINELFMQNRLSLTLGPTRLRCIMLPVECLFKGLAALKKQNTL